MAVDLWNKDALKSLLLPGGFLLLAAVVLLHSGVVSLSPSAVTVLYYIVFIAGLVLAWRFHSSRSLLAIIVLLLAHSALEFFSGHRPASSGSGYIALEAIAILLPLNFVYLLFLRERGFVLASVTAFLGALFLQSVFVAVLCRPGQISPPSFLDVSFLPDSFFAWTRLPPLAWLAFAAGSVISLVRLLPERKPIEGGLFWALAAAFLGMQAGGGGKIGSAYFTVSGLILACAIIENSYFLAYHDELTTLPARRSFNDALLSLPERYTIAVVDIDHFKNFNDTYGHDIGDQVLRMVAGKLARVSGGGHAFRVGGEEFSILFPGERLTDALPHLEILRMEIESTAFRVRDPKDRRSVSHGTDRRQPAPKKRATLRRKTPPASPGQLSVTVSIGVAQSTTRLRQSSQVIDAADKALYRAKRAGRNRVEVAEPKSTRLKRSIA